MIEFLVKMLTSPLFWVSLAIAIILFVVYFFLCVGEISAINKELKSIANGLEKPQEFQNIDALFKNHKRLLPTWTNFKKTLTVKKYSTTDAAEFFNVANLTRGMNMTFWQNYGGIFTGLGILGTFAGLTAGLIGIDMTSGNVDVLKEGIKKLLSGIETAFVTSLVGIFFALVYSLVHHVVLKNFQGNVQRLAEKLDENFPRRSAEDWLAKSHSEFQEQTTELQNIDEQIAAETSWLEKSYGEVQTQSASLQNIDVQIAAGNSLLAKNLTESQNQTTTLQSIDTNIDSQKTILQNIGEDVARAIYDGLDNRMDSVIENLCAKLEEKLLPQTNKICNSIEKIDENIGSSTEKICAAINKLGEGDSKALGEIFSQKVGGQMDKFSEALDRFSNSIDEKLKNAYEVSKTMNEQLLNTLKALDENLRQHAEDSAKERAATFEEFVLTLAALNKALEDLAEKIKVQQEGSIGNFNLLIKNLIGQLEEFTKQQKDILNNSAHNHATQISEAVKAFREIVDRHNETTKKTFAQVQILLNDTETYLEVMNDASISLNQAAEPVKQSALQLTNHIKETTRAAENFRREITTQMTNLAATNQTTSQNLTDLSARLNAFVDNFNGIANEFERSTKTIKDCLDNYNVKTSNELSDALTKFGNEMTKALSGLDEIIGDFSEVVGYVKQNQRG